MSKTLLIIGGTGFFGNSILKYFSKYKKLKNISKIIVISRNKFKRNNYLITLKKNYKLVKINKDILKLIKVPYADYVIYAANSKNKKKDYLATKNYIKLAKVYHKKSKILYTSSGAVYGIQKKDIKCFKENHFKIYKKIEFNKGYKKLYANIKYKSEKLFLRLENFGMHISIARCFAFVGEFLPLNSHYIIGNLIENILNKEKILIKAKYPIYRSYMYSDDLVRWLIKILFSSNSNAEIYNVGSNDKVSIDKIVNILGKRYNLNYNISEFKSKRIDKYLPDINKAKKKLGLNVRYNSLEAIFKTINLLKNSKKSK